MTKQEKKIDWVKLAIEVVKVLISFFAGTQVAGM